MIPDTYQICHFQNHGFLLKIGRFWAGWKLFGRVPVYSSKPIRTQVGDVLGVFGTVFTLFGGPNPRKGVGGPKSASGFGPPVPYQGGLPNITACNEWYKWFIYPYDSYGSSNIFTTRTTRTSRLMHSRVVKASSRLVRLRVFQYLSVPLPVVFRSVRPVRLVRVV